MPKPGYIIIANSGAIDRATNRVSMFNILEGIEVEYDNDDAATKESASAPMVGESQEHVRDFRMIIVSTWLQDKDDGPDDEFETQMICTTDKGEVFFASAPSRFKFTGPVHRMIVPEQTLTTLPEPGICTVKAEVRRVGNANWGPSMIFSFAIRRMAKSETPAPTPNDSAKEPKTTD